MMRTMEVRSMLDGDEKAVLAIYQAGIDTGNATFATCAPEWAAWDVGHLSEHRFVAVEASGTDLLGWAALSRVSDRCVYAGVAEVSVYVDPAAWGRGVGGALLARVVESADANGIWTIQAGIFPENTASLALHQRAGFRIVGRRERLGCHHGQWRDVLLLERRSVLAGQ